MPAYGYNRLFAIPFIAFAAFGIFFTLNLILATVYSSHKRRIATSFERETAVQEDSLDRAFLLLQADARRRESEKRERRRNSIELPGVGSTAAGEDSSGDGNRDAGLTKTVSRNRLSKSAASTYSGEDRSHPNASIYPCSWFYV